MRKKYLSALLFGALLFASAGTFTSCKDYDDDINNLQSQITANADAIKALQSKVDAGKWVTEVSAITNGFKVTFSDGQSFEVVNGADGAAGADGTQITIGEDGYWYFDGEKSEYKAVSDEETGKTKAPYVNEEDGYWYFYNEDGTAQKSAYKALGAAYAVAYNGGFNIMIPDADGTMQTIFVPGAAASITEMTLGEETNNGTASTIDGTTVKGNAFLISRQKFTFVASTSAQADGITAASKWKGNKTLPNNGDYVYASPTTIDLRIDPVDVLVDGFNFYLTNTKNADLSPIVLTAKGENGNDPLSIDGVNSRANTGNGLWELSMENKVVSKDSETAIWNAITKAETNEYAYAVNADHSFRSKYELQIQTAKAEDLTQLTMTGLLNGKDKTYKADIADLNANTGDVKFKTGKAYTVEGVEKSALYDMYLSADQSDCDVFELSFDQDKHTFTIGKNPDVSTIPANFDLIVYTVANNGAVNKTVITVQVDSQISANPEYSLQEHSVNKDNDVNYFSIDLATMKTALGDNLNQWMQNVDLINIDYQWSDKENSGFTDMPTGIAPLLVEKTAKKSEVVTTTDRNKANYIQVNVDNAEVAGLKLDKTYYIKVTFKAVAASGGGELNSIVVPVEFHAPALSDLFSIREGYVQDGVINAYFYDTAGSTAVELSRYFSAFVKDAAVAFDGKIDNVDSDKLFDFTAGTLFDGNSVDFDAAKPGINEYGQSQNGYGKVVTVKTTKSYYNNVVGAGAGWDYTATGSDEYKFQIRLMSPIYEGSVAVLTGTSVEVSANDFVNGARITHEDIQGRDYNGNDMYIFPDQIAGGVPSWKNKQISDVTPKVDTDNYIDEAVMTSASTDADGNIVKGYIRIKGRALSTTTSVELPVTIKDAWGYKLNVTVPVTVKMNE